MLLHGHGLPAPLRCGAPSKTPQFSNDIKIDDGAEKSENHHGDTNRVLMETASRGVDACGSSESRKTDSDAQAANGDDCGAGALKNGEDKAGPIEKCHAEEPHPDGARGSLRLRNSCRGLCLFTHELIGSPKPLSSSCLETESGSGSLRAGGAAVDPSLHLSNGLRTGEGRRCSTVAGIPSPADEIIGRNMFEKLP